MFIDNKAAILDFKKKIFEEQVYDCHVCLHDCFKQNFLCLVIRWLLKWNIDYDISKKSSE